MLRLDDVLKYQLCPLAVGKNKLPLFRPLCPAFSFADVDTYDIREREEEQEQKLNYIVWNQVLICQYMYIV